VKPVKIYTRTGDRGETSLLGGLRVPKDHLRVAAYGDVDETNAAIGAVRALAEPRLGRLLFAVQKELFAIGARLADPTRRIAAKQAKSALGALHVRRLEKAIDEREKTLPPLRSFVLPGGTPAAALLHQARTVCRRAERSVVTLAREVDVDPRIVVYLNRLSDLLFVLARYENHRAGLEEERW
jgi:cob(I)alamin adenosyltransferase